MHSTVGSFPTVPSAIKPLGSDELRRPKGSGLSGRLISDRGEVNDAREHRKDNNSDPEKIDWVCETMPTRGNGGGKEHDRESTLKRHVLAGSDQKTESSSIGSKHNQTKFTASDRIMREMKWLSRLWNFDSTDRGNTINGSTSSVREEKRPLSRASKKPG